MKKLVFLALADWDSYDVVFIGCPVWWHEAPMIIHTFCENYDFKGKTVVPFCTYASTYRDETLAKIVEITPDARHPEGFGVRSRSTAGITEWLDRIGMIPSDRITSAIADDSGDVAVFDTTGSLVYSGSHEAVRVPRRGFYIVRSDSRSAKMIM